MAHDSTGVGELWGRRRMSEALHVMAGRLGVYQRIFELKIIIIFAFGKNHAGCRLRGRARGCVERTASRHLSRLKIMMLTLGCYKEK